MLSELITTNDAIRISSAVLTRFHSRLVIADVSVLPGRTVADISRLEHRLAYRCAITSIDWHATPL
jgi:hypothetical protein